LIDWSVALLMTFAAIAGGYFGATAARKVGRTIVRRGVVLIGLVIGCVMLWRTFVR
jgi:uncharacterized membrane protein YfcA